MKKLIESTIAAPVMFLAFLTIAILSLLTPIIIIFKPDWLDEK